MERILENIWAILERGKGIFMNMFIWWKGLFWNIIKERVSFAKRLESGRTLIRIGGKGGAFGQNSPVIF